MKQFAFGLACGLTLAGGALGAQVAAHVNTNGTLFGYIVQDGKGREICRDPEVWNQFRGQESYIICK